MRGLRIAWITVLGALAALTAPAAAQPDAAQPDAAQPDAAQPDGAKLDPPAPAPDPAPAKDPKVAKKWLAAGQQLLRKGDWSTRAKRPDDATASYQNAVTALEKSIEAGDDVNTYALLAEAQDKLGRHDLAWKHYRVVVQAEAGVRPDVLKRSAGKLDELSMKVGIVTLVVSPEGATIALAGAELGQAPLAEPLILMPGTYTVSFQAEGHQPREAELVVEAGAESERTFELEAVKIVVVAPAVDEEPVVPPPPPPRPSRLPLYAGGGAAAALLGTAAVTGLLAVGRHGTFTSPDATPSERDAAKSSGEALALVTDLALVGGLAAAGFTAYWYFVKYKPAQGKRVEQRPGPRSAKLDLFPWVQPDASGLTLAGAF